MSVGKNVRLVSVAVVVVVVVVVVYAVDSTSQFLLSPQPPTLIAVEVTQTNGCNYIALIDILWYCNRVQPTNSSRRMA